MFEYIKDSDKSRMMIVAWFIDKRLTQQCILQKATINPNVSKLELSRCSLFTPMLHLIFTSLLIPTSHSYLVSHPIAPASISLVTEANALSNALDLLRNGDDVTIGVAASDGSASTGSAPAEEVLACVLLYLQLYG